jgi:hypothetical protein
VGFTLTGARAGAPPALPVEALDPPSLVVERGELADLRAAGHEEKAPHLATAAVRGLDRGRSATGPAFGIGSGLNSRADRRLNIASPIGMLRRE